MSTSFFGWLCIFVIIFHGILILNLEGKPSIYQGLSDKSILLYEFIDRQGVILGKKYNMKQRGNGLEAMDKVKKLSISFGRMNSQINEDEARSLIIQCVEDFLEAINNNEQLRPFLACYPFTANNIDFTIFNIDNDELQTFPNIAVVSNKEGCVSYFTVLPEQTYGYHTEKYETFGEAVAKLKESSCPSNQFD